jgi:hypothetical protein
MPETALEGELRGRKRWGSPEGEAAAALVQQRHGSRRPRPKRPPRRKIVSRLSS